MTEVCIIAAISGENRVIGKDGGMPWRISADLKHFKDLTMGIPAVGHPVIMGRITFESIVKSLKKPLPDRPNIVITRKRLSIDGVMVRHDLEEAIRVGKTIDPEKVFIIGGGEIYKQALELPIRSQIDRLYLTLVEPPVEGDYEGDTFFPDYSEFNKIISEEQGEEKEVKFKFIELERK